MPGPGQILVRSLACGICASDIHFMDHPEGDAEDDSGLSNYDPNADIVMGHEYCAEIVDYGPQTQRAWSNGTRVSSIPALLTPGGVRIIGQSNEAPGGFGEYFLLTEGMTQVVPGELPDELVSIADAISVGWSYVKRAAVTAKEVPLVIGCGAIGLAAIASLTATRGRSDRGRRLRGLSPGHRPGHGRRRRDRPGRGVAVLLVEGCRLRFARNRFGT